MPTGCMRVLSNRAQLCHGDIPCPAGRPGVDGLITVDVTHLAEDPAALDILCPAQTVDDLAALAGTIGYEVLTALGPRYGRRYVG